MIRKDVRGIRWPAYSFVLLAAACGPPVAKDASFPAESGGTVSYARATQPNWSSPLVTTTGLLENRLRFDTQQQHAGNGARTTVLDGGRGLDLIVGETEEIQIGAPPYEIRDIRSNSSSTSEAR